jgi:hypothetical protein
MTFLRDVRHGAALLPIGLAAAGTAVTCRQEPAARRMGVRTASRPRTLPAAFVTTLLGLLSLVPLGLEVLFVLRGLLYGLVDPGPYGDAWGGPTRAGAWLAHAAIGAVLAVAGLAALRFLARLQRRLVASLDGRSAPGWTVPVTLVATGATAALVVAWTRQI